MASTWDSAWESEIDNDTNAALIDDEIRDTRVTVRTYAAREHLVDLDNDAEADLWKHAAGSARVYVQSSEPSDSGWDETDEGKVWVKTQDHGQSSEPDNLVAIYVWVWDSSDSAGEWQPYADPTMTGAVCYFLEEPDNITTNFPWVPLDGSTIAVSSNPEYKRLIEHLNPGGTSVTLPDVNGEYIRVVKAPGDGVLNPADGTYTHYGSQIPAHDHTITKSQLKHTHDFTTDKTDLSHNHNLKGTSDVGGTGDTSFRSSGTNETVTTEGASAEMDHNHTGTTDSTVNGSWNESTISTDSLGSGDDSSKSDAAASPTSIYNSSNEVVPPSIVMRAYIHA